MKTVREPLWAATFHALARRPGVILFLGASDTGKTTFVRSCAAHFCRSGVAPVAILDSDIGQSTVGPPATVGLSMLVRPSSTRRSLPCHALSFVGSVSPVGHLLQIAVATRTLADEALRRGAKAVLIDTTGLVVGTAGFQLKSAKIALLDPQHVVAFQRRNELEPVLSLFEHRPNLAIHRLPACRSARLRSLAERYRYRTRRFRAYFRRARSLAFDASRLIVLSPPSGRLGSSAEPLLPLLSLDRLSPESLKGLLVGLNYDYNRTVALGLIQRLHSRGDTIEILAPLREASCVRVIQISNIRLARRGEDLGE
ncbi:MAG TPA: Clp1/GlmU family protein [candidate division Zixibacteria bacterium]|nr:Clp1/GlmU family protein [candidate division Zixibacteria bacterium]